MKKLFALFIAVIAISGCSKEERRRNTNPFIPNYNVNIEINLNLPSYSNLRYVSGTKHITDNGAGLNGIIVYNADGNNFKAYEATCPNQIPTTCSVMQIEGLYAVCPCDNVKYSLIDGYGPAEWPLLAYRVEKRGDILRIYN